MKGILHWAQATKIEVPGKKFLRRLLYFAFRWGGKAAKATLNFYDICGADLILWMSKFNNDISDFKDAPHFDRPSEIDEDRLRL